VTPHELSVYYHDDNLNMILFFCRQSARVMLHLFKSLQDKGFSKLHLLNLGGGLGIDYTRDVSISSLLSLAARLDTFQKMLKTTTARLLVKFA